MAVTLKVPCKTEWLLSSFGDLALCDESQAMPQAESGLNISFSQEGVY